MPITDEDLLHVQRADHLVLHELDGLDEKSDAWWLGLFAVAKKHNYYKWGFAGTPSATTRLIQRPMTLDGSGAPARVVVLREFDRFGGADDPPEVLVGYVPEGLADELMEWIAFLNDELRQRRTAASRVRGLMVDEDPPGALQALWQASEGEERADVEKDAAASLLDDDIRARATALQLFARVPQADDRHALAYAARAYRSLYESKADPFSDASLWELLERVLGDRAVLAPAPPAEP